MILYLLLCLLFGFIFLLGLTLLIVALVKKRKKLYPVAITVLIVGLAGGVFSAVTYTRKVISYVKSTDFQEDISSAGELAGETAGSVASGVSKGVANTLDEVAIAALAAKSAQILSGVTKTVSATMDTSLGSKLIFRDKSLEGTGIAIGRAEEKYNPETNDLTIFLEFSKDCDKVLRLTNYDQTGKKIESVDLPLKAKAGDQRVEIFSFKFSDLGYSTYFILSVI